MPFGENNLDLKAWRQQDGATRATIFFWLCIVLSRHRAGGSDKSPVGLRDTAKPRLVLGATVLKGGSESQKKEAGSRIPKS